MIFIRDVPGSGSRFRYRIQDEKGGTGSGWIWETNVTGTGSKIKLPNKFSNISKSSNIWNDFLVNTNESYKSNWNALSIKEAILLWIC